MSNLCPFQHLRTSRQSPPVLLRLGLVCCLARVSPVCSSVLIFLSLCPHFSLPLFLFPCEFWKFCRLHVWKLLTCLSSLSASRFIFCFASLLCLLTVWQLMLEGRTFKNESAGTWGYHQLLALLSDRYKFGSNLGVLTHKAAGDQVCHRGDLLDPWGRGWSEVFAFVSLPSHCHPQRAPVFSSNLILCKIENVRIPRRRPKINIWIAGVFLFVFVFGLWTAMRGNFESLIKK